MSREHNGSVKLLLLVIMLGLFAGLGSAATYLPSTKYINIQTQFDELTVTLEKFARVDFIAYCPGFNNGRCPKWGVYNTTITQNSTHVTFVARDRGAYIGIYSPQNLTTIKERLEASINITITKLNITKDGLYFEFKLPLKGAGVKQVGDAVIVMKGLKNETMFKRAQRVKLRDITYKNRKLELRTDVVALEAKNFTQATIKVPKEGTVNTIMKCSNWDFNTSTCGAWTATSIPFSQDDNYVYFNVTGFSAYSGVELTLLNVQSYPTVGGYWTVHFTTQGTANLTIEGWNGTVYGTDIEFDSLKCGDTVVPVTHISNGIFVENYTCDGQTSYHQVKVLTAGKHTQRFTFGTIVKYARNLANNMPNVISVEGKLTNSTNDNQNGTFNITFRIWDAAIGGNKLWEENITNVVVDEGIFSVRLGESNPLDLDWNQPYYLELQVENDANMTPRINLTSTPFSKSADRSFNVSCTNCIDETQIDTTGNFLIEGSLNMTGAVINMHTHKIINLAEPTDAQDAATKNYVDSQFQAGASGWVDSGTIVGLSTSTDNLNATALWVNNTNGRVGIGTYNPDSELHVVGNIHVTNNITSTNYAIEETSNSVVISASGTKSLILTTNASQWE